MRTFTQTAGLTVVVKAAVALLAGDCCCVATWTQSDQTVTLATPEALAGCGKAFGVVFADANEGEDATIVRSGALVRGVTGLAAAAPGLVRVNPADGRPQRVERFSAGDYPVGTVDADGTLDVVAETGALGGSVFRESPGAAQVVNVSDPEFGAVGSGAGDDTAAFLAAIASSDANNIHEIFIPSGQYIISDTLTITRAGTVLRSQQPPAGGYNAVALRWRGAPYASGTGAVVTVGAQLSGMNLHSAIVSNLVGVDHSWPGKVLRLAGTSTVRTLTGITYVGTTDAANGSFMQFTGASGMQDSDVNLPIDVSGSATSAVNSASYSPAANPLFSYEMRGAFRISRASAVSDAILVRNVLGTGDGDTNITLRYTRNDDGYYTIRRYISPTSVEIWVDKRSPGEWANGSGVGSCTWSVPKPVIEILAPDCMIDGLTLVTHTHDYEASAGVETGQREADIPDDSINASTSLTFRNMLVFGGTDGRIEPRFGRGFRFNRPLNIHGETARIVAKSGDICTVHGLLGARIDLPGLYNMTFYGSSHSGNNGGFLVHEWIDSTSIAIVNPAGVVDADEQLCYTLLYELSNGENFLVDSTVAVYCDIGFLQESLTSQAKGHIYNGANMGAVFCRIGVQYLSGNYIWIGGGIGHCDTAIDIVALGDRQIWQGIDFESNARILHQTTLSGFGYPAMFLSGRCDFNSCTTYDYVFEVSSGGPYVLSGLRITNDPGRPVPPAMLAFSGITDSKTLVHFDGCVLTNDRPMADYVFPGVANLSLFHRVKYTQCLIERTDGSYGVLDDALTWSGTATITGTSTSAQVVFSLPISTAYRVQLSFTNPSAGAAIPHSTWSASMTSTGFWIHVDVAPGGVETIDLNWSAHR